MHVVAPCALQAVVANPVTGRISGVTARIWTTRDFHWGRCHVQLVVQIAGHTIVRDGRAIIAGTPSLWRPIGKCIILQSTV